MDEGVEEGQVVGADSVDDLYVLQLEDYVILGVLTVLMAPKVTSRRTKNKDPFMIYYYIQIE